MPIVLVRIDDRLIHGQIVEGWVRPLDADYIVVVSDEVANDKMQQTLLSMAVPINMNVSCFTIDDAASKIKQRQFENNRALMLFSCPQDILRVLEKGAKLPSVNVGGMHYVTGKAQILKTLSVDQDDINALEKIGAMGVELEGRVLPDDEEIDVLKVIEKGLEKNNE